MSDFMLLAQEVDGAGGWVVGGVFFFVMLIISVLFLVLWIWALISAIQNPALDSTMRIVWVLVIVFTGLLGALIYLIVAPKGQSTMGS